MAIHLTYSQAQQILEAFGGDEESVLCVMSGEGHSGKGIYVGAAEYPEEGSDFIGPES